MYEPPNRSWESERNVSFSFVNSAVFAAESLFTLRLHRLPVKTLAALANLCRGFPFSTPQWFYPHTEIWDVRAR